MHSHHHLNVIDPTITIHSHTLCLMKNRVNIPVKAYQAQAKHFSSWPISDSRALRNLHFIRLDQWITFCLFYYYRTITGTLISRILAEVMKASKRGTELYYCVSFRSHRGVLLHRHLIYAYGFNRMHIRTMKVYFHRSHEITKVRCLWHREKDSRRQTSNQRRWATTPHGAYAINQIGGMCLGCVWMHTCCVDYTHIRGTRIECPFMLFHLRR